MIKDVIVALLTTTINRYSNSKVLPAEAVCRELTDILDYVADIPEPKWEEDKEILKGYIRELEDSCENMNQVEINLAKKIGELNEENERLRNIISEASVTD